MGLWYAKRSAHDEVAGTRGGNILETAWAAKGRVGRMAKAQKDGPRGTGLTGERVVLPGLPDSSAESAATWTFPAWGPPPSGILSKFINSPRSKP